ncbi:MAG TPA: PaaI family thioesterase [Nitrococcus sp.]|nr:PaaI family thioesterase [Nitrococcus sp.]
MTDFVAVLQAARQARDYQRIIDLIPYARLLGIRFSEDEHGLLFQLPFQRQNLGNPYQPALHGGVIGACMENAAIVHLLWNQESFRLPKIIDFSVDYLSPGRAQELYVRCDVRRQGRRVANVGIVAWQAPGQRIVATARTHFLLTPGAV